VKSRTLLDRMKPEEVDEATHEVTVDGLMREEIALELLELQKLIA